MTVKEWQDEFLLFKTDIRKSAYFDRAIERCLSLHSQIHEYEDGTLYSDFISGVSEDLFKKRKKNSYTSIAWHIWHITRIEDAVSNVLIAGTPQIFDDKWKAKINSPVYDTANAFSRKDSDVFNDMVNMKNLLAYRKKVGISTRGIIKKIRESDLKSKPDTVGLKRITAENVLTEEPDSFWLLDFWSKKTVAGFLLLPVTNHQMYHIRMSMKLSAALG
ncbi:MAG: DinB family protein [Spirochaetes bacterium]|nr:DinB family protein [Spirochaetota bacterium]